MTSRKIRTLALVALVVFSGLVTGVTAVAAQQTTETGATDGAAGGNQTEQKEDDGPHTAAFDLDTDVRVTSINWYEENETMHIGFHNRGDDRATVYVAEIVEAGAESWGFRTLNMRPDEETTVVLEGIEKDHGEEVVMVASEQSLANENVEWLSTGPDPVTIVTLVQGVAIGLICMTAVTGGMAWRRYNKPGSSPESALKDDKGWF